MADIVLKYKVDGNDYQRAGEASRSSKFALKKLGLPSDIIRRVGICMYEGEINMVIHADGGEATLTVGMKDITIVLKDKGPGIPEIELAMEEVYATAVPEVRDMGFGAGMGLPNIKNNVDKLNVQSTVGVGTTVEMEENFK